MPMHAELIPTTTPPGGSAGAARPTTDSGGKVAQLFMRQKSRSDSIAAGLGLQTGNLNSLFHVPPDDGIARGDLAEWRACADDRRVKPAWLIPLDAKRRAVGMAGFGHLREQFAGLPFADLRAPAPIHADLGLPA